MKNTLKFIAAAFITVAAVACGSKSETSESQDTVAQEAPAPAVADTTATTADTTATSADTTAAAAK